MKIANHQLAETLFSGELKVKVGEEHILRQAAKIEFNF